MTKDDQPPLPRSPVQSWMIDDDGAQHPCLVAPTFSTEELQVYGLQAIAAHDAKREKVLLIRQKATSDFNNSPGFWMQTSDRGLCLGYEFAWAYIEREGA